MKDLISIDNLIKQAKQQGIDFGKGDPYNRLRYYTKMGWLPHMTRKSDKRGNIKGHYPEWTLNQLLLIESLKSQGYSNEEIEKKVERRTKYQGILSAISSSETRAQFTTYMILLFVILITISELGVLNISKPKNTYANLRDIQISKEIMDSGTAFMPKNTKEIFVKTSKVSNGLKVYLSFNENYTPASRYWVSEIKDKDGFTVELDAPVSQAAEFNWWVSN